MGAATGIPPTFSATIPTGVERSAPVVQDFFLRGERVFFGAGAAGSREQLGQGEGEAGQHVASVERLGFAERYCRGVRSGVNRCLSLLRIDHPDEPDAGEEVFAELAVHLLGCVALAENLDRQVRSQVGHRLRRQDSTGQLVPAEEGHVRNANQPLKQTYRAIGTRGDAQIVPSSIHADIGENFGGQIRFAETHRLLHQGAINEFVEPSIACHRSEQVALGGGARRRPKANALQRDIAQPLHQFGGVLECHGHRRLLVG